MNRVFTLLVGINEYQRPVSQLNGCIKDLDQIEALLKDYVPQEKLHTCRLENRSATYSAIIDAFRSHLCKAGPDDTVWFHFSGHGSEEFTADEFWPIEPKGLDQTLLCYNSGTGEIENLADKELAILLNEVSSKYPDGSPKKNSPHIVVTLDCCHSGSGTRSSEDDIRVRSSPTRGLKRDVDSYANGYYSKQQGRIQVPLSKHIALSACQSTQEASDLPSGGAFTSGLVSALRNSACEIDYSDLFLLTRSRLRRTVKDQVPQFDSYANFNPYGRFLTGDIIGTPSRFEVTSDNGTWYVECGAIHGLPTHNTEPVDLDIYGPQPDRKHLGTARLKSVGALRSPIDLDTGLDVSDFFASLTATNPEYRAEFRSIPIPPEPVLLEGTDGQLEQLRKMWLTKSVVKPSDNAETATLLVKALADYFAVYDLDRDVDRSIDSDDSRAEVFRTEGTDGDSLKQILGALEKIVKWRRFIYLTNHDRASQLNAELSFSLDVYSGSPEKPQVETYQTSTVELTATTENTQGRKFGISPKITVKSPERDIFFYCFYIDQNYSISCPEGERVYREDQRTALATYNQTMWSEIKGFGPEPHVQSTTAWLKVIATTRQINPEKFCQEGLGPTRGLKFRGEDLSDDWAAFTMRLKVDWK